MQNDIRKKRSSGRLGAILSAAIAIIFVLFAVVPLVFLMLWEGEGMELLMMVGIYFIPLLAIAVGVVIALVQRLREIREGEEEDARKY